MIFFKLLARIIKSSKWLRYRIISAGTLFLFVSMAIRLRVPLRLWRRGWIEMKAEHEAWIRKQVWILRTTGEVYQDSEGRLWSKDK